MTCTGVDVRIVYNAGCTDLSGERRNCYAGFNGQSTVQVSWSGSSGPPNWWTAAQQGSPTACHRQHRAIELQSVYVCRVYPPVQPLLRGPHHCVRTVRNPARNLLRRAVSPKSSVWSTPSIRDSLAWTRLKRTGLIEVCINNATIECSGAQHPYASMQGNSETLTRAFAWWPTN